MKQHIALDGTNDAGVRRTSFRQKPDGKIDPAGEAGWYLQYERERRGESLADASVETKIKAKYLHALELGALDQLPGWPYVIGYVRSYAKFLGLEPEPLVQHYLTFVRRPAMIERFAGRSAWLRRHEAMRATAAFAGTAAIVVLGLWAAFSDERGALTTPKKSETAPKAVAEAGSEEADPVITGSIRRPELEIAVPPPAIAPAGRDPAGPQARTSVILDGALPTVRVKEKSLGAANSVPRPIPKSAVLQNDVETALASDGDDTRAPADLGRFIASQMGDTITTAEAPRAGGQAAATPAAKPGDGRIALRARSNVWARIEDGDGNALLNRTLAQGEVFHVPDQRGLVLIVRDAGALEFSLDGQPYSPLGRPGQILVSHPLEPDRMKTLGG